MSDPLETYADRVLAFTVPDRNVRGRLARLDGVADTVLSSHDYPPAIKHLLAEALVLAALIGSLLKDAQGQMTMQAQTEGGVVRLLVCDYRAGELRGYVDFDAARMGEVGANPSLFALFGKGYLAITFDLAGEGGRYQGIVPLEGESLAEACETYFAQSEQVPTLIRVAARSTPRGCIAAGLLVQHMPKREEGGERLLSVEEQYDWDHVAALAGSIRHDELLDDSLSLEALVWRLFHEETEVRVEPGDHLARGCRCSVDHYRSVIERFPLEERAAMRDDQGRIMVDCAFCSRLFQIEA